MASASATPTWLAPTDISGPTQSITFPEVAVNAAGDAVAIWPRDIGSETVLETLERPAGGAWSASEVLSEPGEGEPSQAHIALDTAGNAVAVWRAFDTGFAIRTAVRPAGGEWSAPEDLSAGSAETPSLAMNAAGDAVAVWTGFDGVDDYVTWAAVRPAGGNWSAPEELAVPDEEDGFYPQVAIDAAGTAIAVWQRFDLSYDAVAAAVRPAGGGNWSAPDELSTPAENARSPRIAMNAAGSAVAAWSGIGGGIHSALRPAGADWSAPEEVSAVGADPSLAIDSSGSAFAVWPGPGSTDQVLRVATRPPGGSWSAAQDLSGEASTFQSYDLDASAVAGVVATWTRGVSATSHEVQAAVHAPGDDWSAPQRLSAEGENAGLPDLGFDAAGNAVAIWGRDAGADYVLQGAGYDFSGPRLDGLQVPATGTVGEPVSFAVSPFDVFSLGATSWTFGDGSQAGGNAVSHVYATPGKYPVTVSAFDGSGNESAQTETIAIAAGPSKPKPPPPNRRVTLTLRIEGKSLRTLKRTGTLRVATSVNKASNVALSGRARLKIHRARGRASTRLVQVFVPKTVRFDAGGEGKVTLSLSKPGRRALRPLSRARLQIAGEARDDAGGTAAKAVSRTLR